MTNTITLELPPKPERLLSDFTDTSGAAALLNKAQSTVVDMANRGLITRYRVGTAVLYWSPEVKEVARALQRLRARA